MRHTHQLHGSERVISEYRKESDLVRYAHQLETAEGATSQNMERKRPSEAYSQTGDRREGGKSRHGKKATERGALTNWR